MAQSFCPHCGFGNSSAYVKPSTCSKCKRSLSFEVKNIPDIQAPVSIVFKTPVLTPAEQSFISKNKDTMLPIEICQRIFGEQVSALGPEMSAIRQFLNGIGQGVSSNKPQQIIIDDNYVPDNNNYDEENENDNVSSAGNLSDIKSLSYTIESGPTASSMSVEDAIFKYSMRPENKPSKRQKPKGFNAKKELAKIREQASSISKKTNTISAHVSREN
jgi:hypothetical protein